MRVTSSLLACLSGGSAVLAASSSAPRCNADNCARAATGTAGALQSARLAACSSYQQCTVTPATSTITITQTVTVAETTTATPTSSPNATSATETTTSAPETTTSEGETATSFTSSTTTTRRGWSTTSYPPKTQTITATELNRREASTPAFDQAVTECPLAIPTGDVSKYCTPEARYASACSCAGITEQYSTAPAPSTTVTTTVTETGISGPGSVGGTPQFTYIKVSLENPPYVNSPFVGQYLVAYGTMNDKDNYISLTTNTGNSNTQFAIRNSDGALFVPTNIGSYARYANLDTGIDFEPVLLNTPESINSQKYPRSLVKCSITSNGYLSCASDDRKTLQACNGATKDFPPNVGLGTGYRQGCYPTLFKVHQ